MHSTVRHKRRSRFIASDLFKRLKLVFIFTLIVGIAVYVYYRGPESSPDVKAADTDNIGGFAWSENIGWTSFNSVNCDINRNGFIDAGICGGGDITPITNYGVNMDLITGNLSGHAWNEHVGWISFNPSETGPCPAGNCQPRYVQESYSGTTSGVGGSCNNSGSNGSVIIAP